jgi:uncharacterized Zn-finger protein
LSAAGEVPARHAFEVEKRAMPELIQPNAQHQYSVTPADLPLSCPMPGMYLWNSHPRVYLAIEATGWAKCPYCGAEYVLARAARGAAQAAQ